MLLEDVNPHVPEILLVVFKSNVPLEDELILTLLSLNCNLLSVAIVVAAAIFTAPSISTTSRFVVPLTSNVPVVDKFSFPNEIAPLLSVMLPFANVKLPIAEPVAAVNTPVTPRVPPTVALVPIATVPAVNVVFAVPELIVNALLPFVFIA